MEAMDAVQGPSRYVFLVASSPGPVCRNVDGERRWAGMSCVEPRLYQQRFAERVIAQVIEQDERAEDPDLPASPGLLGSPAHLTFSYAVRAVCRDSLVDTVCCPLQPLCMARRCWCSPSPVCVVCSNVTPVRCLLWLPRTIPIGSATSHTVNLGVSLGIG